MYSSSFIHLLLLFTFFLHAQPLVSNKSIIFICIFVLNNKNLKKKKNLTDCKNTFSNF